MRRSTRRIQLLAAPIACSIAAACGHLPDAFNDALNAPTSVGRTAGNPTEPTPVPASRSAAAMPAAVLLAESDEEVSVQELAVHHAMTMLGRPYRLGAETPKSGFDAPGLIHYVFTKAGGVVPRNASELRSASGRVLISNVRLGDLLYFDLDGKKNSHLGIYIGDGRFVHASPMLRRVRMERIDTPYWQRLLSEVRRLDARRAVTSTGVTSSSK
jgi:cell wall-associated NlpC family hydrolase